MRPSKAGHGIAGWNWFGSKAKVCWKRICPCRYFVANVERQLEKLSGFASDVEFDWMSPRHHLPHRLWR